MNLTRREWHRLILGAFAAIGTRSRAAQRIDSTVRGVEIGVQSYSFRDRELHEAIEAMVSIGIGSCELWQGHVEPRGRPRDELRQWRLMAPLGSFETIRGMFDRAGIRLSAYNISFRDDFTDAEIDRGFQMALALGVDVITASSTLSVVPRMARFARQYGVTVAIHNHTNMERNEFARPSDYDKASEMAGDAPIVVNLDIGHLTAANFDAMEFIRARHADIRSLHIKDRKRDDGPNVVWGEGDVPLGPVLRLVRDQGWAIPANIEYEYAGQDTVKEVARCFDYCKTALEE